MKWVFSLVFFLVFTTVAQAQEFNAGFVQGLWYGSEQIFANEPTRVYVAIRNNTGTDLTGIVEFFDNGKLIERNNVSVLNGRIIESWADWTPNYGEHTITASFSRIELHVVGSGTQAVDVISAIAEAIIFIDYDTDGDGIGNEDDLDDDGDGISDEEEKRNGTDPLDADSPSPVSEQENEEGEPGSDFDDQSTSQSEEKASDSGADKQGLEQFLSDGRVDSALSQVTEVINTTKKRLDSYRESRNAQREVADSSQSGESATSTTISSDEYDGSFGPITRTQDSDSAKSFVSAIFGVFMAVTEGLFTLVLFLLSLYLTYPAIVQFTFLVLVLFLLFKVAKRLGGRQNY